MAWYDVPAEYQGNASGALSCVLTGHDLLRCVRSCLNTFILLFTMPRAYVSCCPSLPSTQRVLDDRRALRVV